MKKLLISLAMISLLAISPLALPSPSEAADVIVTITVPDAYVARLTAMVQDSFMYPGNQTCEGLTIKQCFTKKIIIEHIKRALIDYERRIAVEAANNAVTEIEVTGQ